jgi:hypothetical protein
MTRLTDAQIDEVWYATPNLRGFVDAIAALAVQEVERERDRASTMSDQYRAKWADADSRNTALRAQLAEARKDLAAEQIHAKRIDFRRNELAGECQSLRAQLATAKQEAQEEMAAGLLYIWRNVPVGGDAFHELLKAIRDYQNAPATPSGEGCVRCGDTCKPWCHNATPSPEPREVPEVVDLKVEVFLGGPDWESRFQGVRITPADAKRIMDMAQRNI